MKNPHNVSLIYWEVNDNFNPNCNNMFYSATVGAGTAGITHTLHHGQLHVCDILTIIN